MTDESKRKLLDITEGAAMSLHPYDLCAGLQLHWSGNWGLVCQKDVELNSASLMSAGDRRTMSAFIDRKGVHFWIMTELDCGVTTVMVREDLAGWEVVS
ncbi:MAG: hypothetical protein Q7P63_12235 [Verrucomicrobiota bacterium JB022]|nr:hypothetical protein [Verrucomicrobiota bacterium JB022]